MPDFGQSELLLWKRFFFALLTQADEGKQRKFHLQGLRHQSSNGKHNRALTSIYVMAFSYFQYYLHSFY